MTCVMYSDQNMSNRFSEIGSEFWIEDYPKDIQYSRDGVYVLSGRTAIDLIIQDILKHRHARTVYMPAWCCNSMLAPFLQRNIDVSFYDIVYSDKLEYIFDEASSYDIFYLTNYFGYENSISLDQIRKIKNTGATIIYDRTHSFFMCDDVYINIADYSFASIRKWLGVIGGAVVEGIGSQTLKNCPYVNGKVSAMLDKYRFLSGETIRKEELLGAFSQFNNLLANDYRDYKMDDLSYTLYKREDQKTIIQKRRANAAYLHENLLEMSFIGELTENAVPLFVPIIFKNKEQRDVVRQNLIRKQIYCPIHWPKSEYIPQEYSVNDLYDRSLSIICDQRYGLREMQLQVETIKQSI